ncbi:hypothetical protein [Amycolatopsis australiensis]|uniref:Uncharacterized protein n=1 Tax=Amycolatopsis australiensis TaxID=546364 RepID=A0A1K1SQX4_9PSEU|nr:hypothetical protein [Amycolatopsis australiensis]SFW86816.1 hypothetical protein SAMN04489730_6511 [Amycolatopsis australiensis]
MTRWRNRGREPNERWEHREYLPSRDVGLYFDVQIRFFGIAIANAAQNGEVGTAGADHVREAFEDVTSRSSLVRWQAVRQLLANRLMERVPFSVPGAEFREATVVVRVRSEDLEAAMRVEHARHELELDEVAHRQIKARMRFLREECLRDPAAAELFVLLPPSPRLTGSSPAGDPDRLVELVRKWEPDSGWVRAAKTLIDFGDKLTPPQLVMLGNSVRDVMARFSEAERGQQFADAMLTESQERQASKNGWTHPADEPSTESNGVARGADGR